jgi:hypothetical protein
MKKSNMFLITLFSLSLHPALAEDKLSATANLELQEKCAKQAREQFKLDRRDYEEDAAKAGAAKEDYAVFTNHYNEKLNKCFMVTESQVSGTTTYKFLSDAFERKLYGSYNWQMVPGKKYWEVPPRTCTVTLPTGEEKICHSSDEFDELIKYYMEQ